MVNYVKSGAIISWFFKRICKEMDSEHQHLFYSKVCWLSWGNLAHRVFELRLNQVNLKLQGRGRTIADFNDTLSALRGETWQVEAESSNRKFCYVRESYHSGWWWSECWYSIGSCATAWRGLWGIFVVLAGNHQNKLGFGEKSFLFQSRMLQIACKMNSDSEAEFKTITIRDSWLKVSDTYPNFGKEALKKLRLFPST